MTYSRRNQAEEQQEACLKTGQITVVCTQSQLRLDPIDWQQFGIWAPVKVNSLEIASLVDFRQHEGNDILRHIQMKLLEHAALATLHARPDSKALMWSPVEVVPPQTFLSLWIITLETDERIPIIESIKDGQRVYEHFAFDSTDTKQLAQLFGAMQKGEYAFGDTITIKERDRQYSGKIMYTISSNRTLTNRKYGSRGPAGTISTNTVTSQYIVNCGDGFPHIAHQAQIIQENKV